jgi:hypothetical protein
MQIYGAQVNTVMEDPEMEPQLNMFHGAASLISSLHTSHPTPPRFAARMTTLRNPGRRYWERITVSEDSNSGRAGGISSFCANNPSGSLLKPSQNVFNCKK